MGKFLKPFIPNPGILDATPGDPLGYVTNDGMWAAVPCGKKFMIIHNGSQVKVLSTYKQSVDFINNQLKSTKKRSYGRKKSKTS
jgi:hypothetical protein|tara:strand:- start:117 stop:368 length:252 start_codon:yes stop_codon:yes gene_type:complete